MREFLSSKNNNVIYVDFDKHGLSNSSDNVHGFGDVVLFKDIIRGDTLDDRRLQVKYFLLDNSPRLDELSDMARGYMMGQIYKYEDGMAGDDIMVLEEVLQEMEIMANEGKLDKFFENLSGASEVLSGSDLDLSKEDKGRHLTVIDGGLPDDELDR